MKNLKVYFVKEKMCILVSKELFKLIQVNIKYCLEF